MVEEPLAVGVDLVEVERLRAAARRWPGIVARLFTDAELRDARSGGDPWERLAGRFAAKEAAFKALGDGWPRIRYADVEVETGPGGHPRLRLRGRAASAAAGRAVAVSIAHAGGLALAEVVLSPGGSP
jgi:holo-[acyl-carrier protein] synthase